MLFFKRKWQGASPHAAHSPQIHKSDGYLQGQLLVSTPLITASCFHKAVIYLFAHAKDGAMGVIINQPLELVHYSALMEEEAIPAPVHDEIPVYYGGPVDRSRGFVVHSLDYHNEQTLFSADGVAISANTNILRDIVAGRGPRQSLLTVGYAGWTAGQLEQEIEENSWFTVPASPELVFGVDDEMKWSMASQTLGFDMAFYSHHVGHA